MTDTMRAGVIPAEHRAGCTHEELARYLVASNALALCPSMLRDERFDDVQTIVTLAERRDRALGKEAWATAINSASLHLGWSHAAFEREGSNIYEVCNGLADRLAHTELRGLTLAEIQLPFRAFYIVIPPGSGLVLQDGRPVAGAYLTECAVRSMDEGDHRLLAVLAHGAVEPDHPAALLAAGMRGHRTPARSVS
jgi:hypothetical protein